MNKRSLDEQLNDLIESILAGRNTPTAETSIGPLLRIATDLRDLPRTGFKQEPRGKLLAQRSSSMNTAVGEKTSTPRGAREGFHTITPYVIVRDCPGLIDFVKQVFGAEELMRAVGGAGGIHCEIRIGDSMLMLGGGFEGSSFQGPYKPAALHIFPGDVDSFYQNALQAGATSIAAPADQFYGERSASIADPFGNRWYIAKNIGTQPRAAEMRTVTACFHPQGAGRFIAFLEQAFNAGVISRYEQPRGNVIHAEVKLGDSIVEVGEAHGPYQLLPMAIYMYTADVDAMYGQAVAAGGKSLWAPATQPYGERVGGVEDEFGNYWYMASHSTSQ